MDRCSQNYWYNEQAFHALFLIRRLDATHDLLGTRSLAPRAVDEARINGSQEAPSTKVSDGIETQAINFIQCHCLKDVGCSGVALNEEDLCIVALHSAVP
jgi:hypothetical protein